MLRREKLWIDVKTVTIESLTCFWGRNGRENGKRNENEEQQKVYSGTFEMKLLEYFKSVSS